MQTKILQFTAEKQMRLDVFLSEELECTRSYAATIINDNLVTKNNKVLSKNYKMKNGDEICVNIPEPAVLDVVAENIPLDIVYEDEWLLVVNKPKGMVVHPAAGNYNSTLVNALLYHCKDSLSGINGVLRPGIVHRIDKNTSGLLIVAKNDEAHNHLSQQIKEHSFTREYEAVVYGCFKQKKGTVNAPIGRHHTKRKQMAVTERNSKFAITHYNVINQNEKFAHMNLILETGRTHQIRVHMSFLGHPVAGDDVYGPKKVIERLGGQCLHAKKIGFIHPKTGEYMEFDSDLPEYFVSFLRENNL